MRCSKNGFCGSRLFASALLLLLGGAFSLASAQAQKSASAAAPASAGNIEDGKKAFLQHSCFSCHGYSGEGGAGARLAQTLLTFAAFRQYVRLPKRSMPPFGNQVSDAELADIYAFLKSIPPSPNPKSIPLLN